MAILVMRVGVPGALPFFLSEIFEADLLLSFLKMQFFKLSGVILSTEIACGLCTFFYHIPLAKRLTLGHAFTSQKLCSLHLLESD